MTRGLFVTGTDTGVGKTVAAVALLRAVVASGRGAGSGHRPRPGHLRGGPHQPLINQSVHRHPDTGRGDIAVAQIRVRLTQCDLAAP